MGDADESLDGLAQEYVRRLRAGEDVELEAYAEAHPDLAERIREVFPVLVLMEGLKPASGASASKTPEAPAASEASLPERIGPFSVVRELGRGGMGRVYEVRAADGTRRAVKVVHTHLLEKPGFLARFLREVETGLRVVHPGVVQTVASGVAEYEGAEVPYLVLEYVEGTTLRALIEETGGVSERLAREIGASVADALEAIHAAGIVHRDVKPENVVIAPDETVKLMDLGVAFVQEEALRLTQTGEFVGSLLYAAPEQLRSAQVDARADQYALGLLLFELMAGRHPEADGPGSPLTRRFGDGPQTRLRDVAPSATPFLERIIDVLLARDPEERFATAAELAQTLRAGEGGAWWAQQEAASVVPTRPHLARGMPDFIGRDRELTALDEAYAGVVRGAGRVRIVVGEAGIGKSRLVAAWLDRLERRRAPPAVAWLEHGPGAGALGLTPLAAALVRLLGDEVESTVRACLGEQTEAAAALLRHMQTPSYAEEADALTRTSLEALYGRLLRAIAAQRPLVLVVEDLHFASPEVHAWLQRLVPALAADPVFLVLTARPAAGEAWAREAAAAPGVEVLPVGKLGTEEGAALFATALGTELAELALAQEVVRNADGNPFCLIEFAAALREQASRPPSRGRAPLVMPDSVQRLVEDRLASLSTQGRELLAVAACCGDRFDPVLVCEAAGLPRLAGLRLLHSADREHRVLAAEGAAYRFRHHLVQEGLHRELPPALRAAYHTALAAAREARLPDASSVPDGESYAIARHFLLGDEPSRSRPYILAGLEYLLAQAEYGRAERLVGRAIEALPDAEPAMQARLLLVQVAALEGRVDPAKIHAIATSALAHAEEVEDDRLLIDAIDGLGGALARMGRHDLAWPHCERSVAVATRLGDAVVLSAALGTWASCLYDQGRREEAFETGRRGIAMAREAGAAVQAGRITMHLAGLYSEAGRTEEAREYAALALTTSRLHGDRGTERFALSVLSRAALVQCDLRDAHELNSRALSLAHEAGNLRQVATSRMGLALSAFNLGERAGAREHVDESLDLSRRMGYREMELLLIVPDIMLRSTAGDLAGALDAVEVADRLLELVPLDAIAARIHPRAVVLHAWTGAFDEAEERLARARPISERAGARREQVHLEQAAASLLEARGDLAGAASAYAEVMDAFRADDMYLYGALAAVRLGGLRARLGEYDAAREVLAWALEVAERGEMPSVRAESQIWLELLPEGNLEAARLLLERDAEWLSAFAALRLHVELAKRTGSAAERDESRARCERLLTSTPWDRRDGMRERVSLFRDALR